MSNKYIETFEAAEASGARFQNYTTPVGVASYVFFDAPRDYKDDGDFRYKGKLVLSPEEAAELQEFVDYLLDASQTKLKTRKKQDPPYGPHLVKNPETKELEETDDVAFNFSVQAVTKTKRNTEWDRKPAFFDGEGNPIDPVKIGGGSKIAISFQTYLWKNPSGAGVTLQPVAVQVLELVEATGSKRNAGTFGFGATAGGFKGKAKAAAPQGVQKSRPADEAEGDDDQAPPADGGERSAAEF